MTRFRHKLMLFFIVLGCSAQLVLAQTELQIGPGAKSALVAVHPQLAYVGFAQRGVKVVMGNQLFDLGVSLPDSQVRSLAFHNGVLWVGTLSGLYRVEGNGFTAYNRSGGQLPGDTVHALQPFGNQLAVGTNAGLVLFTGQQWVQTSGFPLPGAAVTSLKAHDDKLCVVSNGQVVLYDGTSFQQIPTPPGQVIRRAFPYPGGGLLMASADSVYYRTLAGSLHHLPLSWVLDFEVGDHPNRILLLTGTRIYSFERGDLQYRNLPRMGNVNTLIDRDASGGLHVVTINHLLRFSGDRYYDPGLNSWNAKSLEINEVSATYESKGDYFSPFANANYVVPKSSLNHQPLSTIMMGSLWIGGISTGGVLHQTGQTYRQQNLGGQPYQAGLLNAQGQIDSSSLGAFDRVWKLSKFEIEAFKLAWQQGKVQNGEHNPPRDLREWPGNRPGTNEILAPFYDANGDGVYRYIDGDYPLIKGDQALWWVYNDRSPRRETGTALGVEVHAMAYAFVCDQASGGDTIINYTTFMDLELHNKSTQPYSDTYLALFIDGAIGSLSGQTAATYFGMDVDGDGFYAFLKHDFGGSAYGINPPAQGFYLLKGPIADAGDGIDNNRNGVIDEADERLSFSSFQKFMNDGTAVGNPTTYAHFRNYSQGIWKDSIGMVFGGFGYPGSPNSTSIPARFMFPGDTDPNGWGIGGSINFPVIPPFNWTSGGMGGPNVPADFRGVGGMGPFTFSPGQSVDLTFALIFSRGNDSTAQGSVTRLLEHDAPRIRQWYAQGNFPSCLDLSTVGVAELKVQEAQVRFYPNPVQSVLLVELLEAGPAEVQLYDLQGRLLQAQSLSGAATHALDVQTLRSGMYLVRVQQAGKLKQHKFVKLGG